MNFDALAIWAWKAKVFFFEKLRAFKIDSPLFLGGGSHINYPLHLPLLMTWTYFWLGKANDVLVNLIFALYFISLLGLFYFSLRNFLSRQISLIFTMFLSTLPLLNYHGFNAYADLPLTFYFTTSAIFLIRYFQEKRSAWPILAGLFAGLAGWTKNEGLMLAIILFIVFIIYLIKEKKLKANFKHFLFYILSSAFLLLPWLIFKKIFHLGFSNLEPGALVFDRFHLEVLPEIFKQTFFYHSFHLWPGIFVLVLIFYWPQLKKYQNFYLFLIILGSLIAYFILYFFTPTSQFLLGGTVLGRNLMTIIPLTIFLSALLINPENNLAHKV
jgi:4-amino-4-deoxy-L-arabinose transferase-like glycosyltransferase